MDFTQYSAVIWDLDGTLIDSSDLHRKTWHEAMTRFGIQFDEMKFQQVFGKNNRETVLFFEPDADDARIATISLHKESLYRSLIADDLHFFQDSISLLNKLDAMGVRQAMGTSAPEENIQAVFAISEIEPYFEVVISGDALPPKPDPTVFLVVAEALKVNPDDCLVIEDSVAGVKAAKNAGMTAAAVLYKRIRNDLRDADYFLKDLI